MPEASSARGATSAAAAARPPWRLKLLWALTAGALAGCGGGSSSSDTGATPSPSPAPSPTPAPAPAPSAPDWVASFTRLNDTGIDWCSDNFTGYWWQNFLNCRTSAAAAPATEHEWVLAEDGASGRDALALTQALPKIGTGLAGFDFTRLGANGQALPIQTANWAGQAIGASEAAGTVWSCVRDNVTGLVWEVRNMSDANHLRYYRHLYAWYDSDATRNGGQAGGTAQPQQWSAAAAATLATPCTGLAAGASCNTQNYVAAVNAAGLCGASDWRLPNRDELMTITHLGVADTSGLGVARIDSTQFPDVNLIGTTSIGARARTWTSSTRAETPAQAWIVDFATGGSGQGTIDYQGKPDPTAAGDGSGDKQLGAAVRLVRG